MIAQDAISCHILGILGCAAHADDLVGASNLIRAGQAASGHCRGSLPVGGADGASFGDCRPAPAGIRMVRCCRDCPTWP